jgi:hypothetical protein
MCGLAEVYVNDVQGWRMLRLPFKRGDVVSVGHWRLDHNIDDEDKSDVSWSPIYVYSFGALYIA